MRHLLRRPDNGGAVVGDSGDGITVWDDVEVSAVGDVVDGDVVDGFSGSV
jgi:hypothetical protein